MRGLGWSVAIVLLLLPVVALLEGWVAKSSWPVRSLRVDAPFTRVSAEQIRAVVTPLLKDGFFAVNLGELRRRVAALPWVAKVEVRKRWPDQLDVRVTEQRAFARWNGTALINGEGQRFVVPAIDALAGLPDLSGPDERLPDVVAFFVDNRQRFARIGRTVTGAHLSDRSAWQLDLDGGARLFVGRNRPAQRLARFVDSYRALMQGHAGSFEYVDLRYTNGYAVRWPTTAAPATESPKA